LYNRKRWTGWDLNPRPQQAFLKGNHTSYLTGNSIRKSIS
jgi:hypothetical protein